MNPESKNIVWHQTGINMADRAESNGHEAALLWFIGLSGSGKSTVATALQQELFQTRCQTYILDGDNIRHGLNSDLGFAPEERKENIRRIAEVGKLFVDAGFLTLTSFISPYRSDRQFARTILPEKRFVEVYVKASVETCTRRDPKGLYQKAINGEIKQFTGISAPYEAPETPEIILNTEQFSVEECVEQVMNYLRTNNLIK